MKSKVLFRTLVAATSLTLVSGTGCQMFGILSSEEQDQIKNLRQIVKTISPMANTGLNDFLRNWGYLSSFDLPSNFGIELGSYIGMLPLSGPNEQVSTIPTGNNNTKELLYLRDNTNMTELYFTPVAVAGNQHRYVIKLNKCRYTANGTLTVTTTSNSVWKNPTQPASTWRYGNGQYTESPQSLTLVMTGTSKGQNVGISASLTAFSQLVPRQGSFQLQLPGIVFKADSVTFTGEGNATLSGSLGLGGTEAFNATIQSESGQLHGKLENTKRGYNIDFDYDGSILTAEIKSGRNGSRNLAVIDYENDKQVIKYADGTTEDLILKVVGSN